MAAPNIQPAMGLNDVRQSELVQWIRTALAKRTRKTTELSNLRLFDCILGLQISKKGNYAVQRSALVMILYFDATKNGRFTEEEFSRYARHEDKEDKDRHIRIYLDRLERRLKELWPPGYSYSVELAQNKRGGTCWLTGLGSVQMQMQAGPANQFPSWRCTIDGQSVKTGPIHVATPIGRRLHPKLSISGKWKPPKHFVEYEKFSLQRWQTHRKKTGAQDHPTLFFANVSKSYPLNLSVAAGDYRHYVSTVRSLPVHVTLNNNVRMTVQKIFQKDWDPHINLLPLPVAAPLRLDLLVITKEGKVMLYKDPFEKRWKCSVTGIPNLVADHTLSEPSQIVYHAIRRRTHEVLGFDISARRIIWHGLGIGRKQGHVALIGELGTKISESEIRDSFTRNRKEYYQETSIEFVPVTVPEIQKFLAANECAHFLRLALHFCLRRKFPTNVRIETNVSELLPVSAT